ncbi:MAG TPA: type I glutamate--ammonia ligase [Nitrospira sp.]|jgi:glutamine synthetase|uniref:Glutamine synthetase n=1 Tax=Nitrospira defluvii TaxID=330214 RepID=A0ABM8R7N7_9BACT|nr:type I glutamate--ammonia ligase [Nitrospira defluvii]MBL8043406.1 type I glutamate--ammonia ligase [Nitrospira sp.]MCC7470336.1 type I glutamate--ammonia ligase [Candidatus Nomurabacteria bacterium]MCE7978122.1 type I glutamate--ammonia ligase [Nitrospira sp. NTP1]MBS0160050.1 type I glutamate--ammonia ligase [Nitrospira sp.]MBS0163341.1 type I glutamate--ammonia ligase [Nitrospira sp.]
MNVREVLDFAKKNKVQVVDMKFVDLIGTWQHFTIPVSELTEGLFKDGSGLDGSSIRGWRAINNSDMLLVPDPATACMDPFCSVPTLSLIGNVVDPITREMYDRDPRFIAQKAEKYLQSTKIGDTSYWGPEAEFFIFDHARYDQTNHSAYYHIDSDEGVWNMGQEGVNLGGKIRHKEGYFPVAPTDTQQDIRTEMILEMEKAGIATEKHHHEVATAGQAEIDIRFDSLLRTADKMMMFKYIVKNVARRHGKTVTFMPKPIFGDNGSGMHTHQSIWKDGKPLFAGKEYAGVSQMCLHYIGGILKHAPALAAFTNPSTNSYKRLTPGFEAPVLLAYSSRNRSAGIRIPMYSPSPKAKRIEVRFPDPAANPYLAFAAMLMAGLDGIENKINPGEPAEKDLYDLEAKEAAKIRTMPGSLDEALNHLEKDHQFLLKGGVFSEDLIEAWIGYKRTKEVDTMRLRPHPYEFFLYYDV